MGTIRASSFLALLLAFGATRAGRAEDPRDAARRHYARGLELAGQRGYEAALREFNEAYAISPQFAVLYNIGQAHVALDHPFEAIETLTRYLRDGQDRVPPARREQVQAQIAMLDTRLATLSVTTDRAGAEISIDGRDLGRTPLAHPARVAAGTHTVSAVLEGGFATDRVVTLAEGESQNLYLELPTSPSTPSARAAVARAAAAAATVAADRAVATRASAAEAAAEAASAAARAATAAAAAGPGHPTGTIAVRCAEAGARVVLDDKPLEPAAAARGVSVAAGAHRLSLTVPGRRAAEQTVDVPAGAAAIVICQPLAGASAPEPPRVALDGPPVFAGAGAATPTPEVRRSTVGYALVGLGVALSGAAAGVFIWNRDQSRRSDEQLAFLNNDPRPAESDHYERAIEHNQLADSIQRANYLTVGLTVAAATSLAAGAYLLLKDRPRGEIRTPGGVAAWGGGRAAGLAWNGFW